MLWMQALIAAGLLHIVARRSRWMSVLLSMVVFIPTGDGNSIASAMRGLWGDPSVTTVQLLLLTLGGVTLADMRFGWRVPLFIATAGVLLYASALGPWNLDVYRFGYQPAFLTGVLVVLALAMWWQGKTLYVWLLVFDLFAWHARWLESTNLWDNLFDPLLVLCMLAFALRNGYRAQQNRKTILTKP